MTSLNLVVIRVADLAASVKFYTRLGLVFSEHQHGKGARHFAAELPGCVFELYPLQPNEAPDVGTRVGFHVESMDDVLNALAAFPDCIVAPPKASLWGLRAVVADPDGHRVEITEG
jgi:lactoylglutathione lyase